MKKRTFKQIAAIMNRFVLPWDIDPSETGSQPKEIVCIGGITSDLGVLYEDGRWTAVTFRRADCRIEGVNNGFNVNARRFAFVVAKLGLINQAEATDFAAALYNSDREQVGATKVNEAVKVLRDAGYKVQAPRHKV